MTYDAYGNRTTAGTQNLSYSNANDNRLASGNGVTYDALGNIRTEVIGSTTRTYTYDAENRITAISGDVAAAYTYDAFSRRIKNVTNSVSKEFLYDLNGRPVVELATSTGAYNRGEVFAGGMHLATYSSSNTYFPYTDWMGSERVRTTSAGVVAQTCAWSDFGEASTCTTNTDPDGISPHGYAAYEYDHDTQLHHMWFRYYNPRLGRFMTTDPYGGSMDISDPQSMNRYAYVGGNPVNYFDPLGLCFQNIVINVTPTGSTIASGAVTDCAARGGPGGKGEGDVLTEDLPGGVVTGPSPGGTGAPCPHLRPNCEINDVFSPGSLAYNTFGPPSSPVWKQAHCAVAPMENALGALPASAAKGAAKEAIDAAANSTSKAAGAAKGATKVADPATVIATLAWTNLHMLYNIVKGCK